MLAETLETGKLNALDPKLPAHNHFSPFKYANYRKHLSLNLVSSFHSILKIFSDVMYSQGVCYIEKPTNIIQYKRWRFVKRYKSNNHNHSNAPWNFVISHRFGSCSFYLHLKKKTQTRHPHSVQDVTAALCAPPSSPSTPVCSRAFKGHVWRGPVQQPFSGECGRHPHPSRLAQCWAAQSTSHRFYQQASIAEKNLQW